MLYNINQTTTCTTILLQLPSLLPCSFCRQHHTVGSKCVHDVPRSTTDPTNLLVGNLEPNTPFTLTFQYVTNPTQSTTDKTVLTFTQSTTNTCTEQGCVYSAHPCVCAARCPLQYVRDSNDPTLCVRQSQPTCRLSQCYNEVLNSGIPNCALSNPERIFTVDDSSNPTKAQVST